MSADLSVIILTYNEELHIERCIEKVKDVAQNVFIVDSYSTDKTVEIAKKLGARVYQNKWENNYAKQFNWGLDNLPIDTEWVLRLDADEYLLPPLKNEIISKLDSVTPEISGIVFKRRHIFLERWMKRGTYPVKLLRLFRFGKGRCENRWMDEHIELLEGNSIEFEHDFVDHNLKNLTWWIQKHNNYAIREAIDLLNIEHPQLLNESSSEVALNRQAKSKRAKKSRYVKQPLFIRSFIYFLYRYFLKFGFMEGKEGFLWHFLQGWWYRTLVDAKIMEIKRACGDDPQKIKEYIKEEYGLDL